MLIDSVAQAGNARLAEFIGIQFKIRDKLNDVEDLKQQLIDIEKELSKLEQDPYIPEVPFKR